MTKEARICNGKKAVCPTNGVGKTGQRHAKERKWTTFLHHTQEEIKKWIKDLHVRLETLRIQEESIGSNFSDIDYNNFFFLGKYPEARETKARINYWGYIK